MSNISSYRHFLLDGFGDLGALRSVLFLPFTAMFVVSLLANSLLLYVVVSNRSLHSPMCILIAAMAVVDLSLPLFFVPSMLLNFLLGWRSISLSGCLLQMHLLHFLGALQSTLLVWMALDRYFAICTPLSYHQRMAPQRFLWFVAPLVLRNGVIVSLLVGLAGTLTFCRNVIQHCFCEHMALVELSCGWPAVNSLLGNSAAGLAVIICFVGVDIPLIFFSYVKIISVVLQAAAGDDRRKAFHTCGTHLMVMMCFYLVGSVTFLSHNLNIPIPTDVNTFMGLMYILLPATVNPIIYGVRTKEIRNGFLRIFKLRAKTILSVKVSPAGKAQT
uniref:G-protein coupled receptors family 1 profile domain-containing protein n=1 Tax=Stegastes partitus TaxID=144197 RepID=A0A3B5BAI1_9TELE